jgi:predicted hotdog family 3-hydroxylacyl-ACP dehydratase
MTDHDNILQFIPQRAPFVMIDRLSGWDQKTCCTTLKVTEGNIFLENGLLTEPGILENIAQTAAAAMGYGSQKENRGVPVGYIGAIQNLEIFDLPKKNDEIKTEITIKNQIFNVTVIEGVVQCQDKILARCNMKIFISNQQ